MAEYKSSGKPKSSNTGFPSMPKMPTIDTSGISYLLPKDKIGNLWNDATGKTAADNALDYQLQGIREGIASQEKMFNQSMETQKPWLEAGAGGLSDLVAGIKSGRFDSQVGSFDEPTYQGDGGFQFDFEADPGYQFRLEEGMKGLQGSAAARGALGSGETMKDAMKYSQGLASQEYGNAYARARGAFENDRNFGRGNFESDRNFGYGAFMDSFNRDRAIKNDQYNQLAGLSGTGQIVSGNVGSQMMAQGGNLANINLQQGNARANNAMARYQGGMNLFNSAIQAGGAVAGAVI